MSAHANRIRVSDPEGPDRGGEAVRVPHRLYKEVFMTPEMWGIFLQIVILLAFGYFFTKKKILTSDIKNGLSTLLLKLVLHQHLGFVTDRL